MSTSYTPSDLLATRFPISIKGVVEVGGRVVLLRNERDEWELPGGKLEAGESPKSCLEREIFEELNVRVEATSLLDAWVYNVAEQVAVFIVTFDTSLIERSVDIRRSQEHKEARSFSYDEIAALNMPTGYKDSIARSRSNRPDA